MKTPEERPVDVTPVPQETASLKHAPFARADHAALSLFVPGLGQLAQGRPLAALAQFGTVAGYLIATFGLGGRRALLLALVWNVWSVIDASRHER